MDINDNGTIFVIKNNNVYVYGSNGEIIKECTDIVPDSYEVTSGSGIYKDGYILLRVYNHEYYNGVIDENGNIVLGFNYTLKKFL